MFSFSNSSQIPFISGGNTFEMSTPGVNKVDVYRCPDGFFSNGKAMDTSRPVYYLGNIHTHCLALKVLLL